MKITTIVREIEISTSQEVVWGKIADFGNICHGHPAVKKSYITSEQQQGVWATRHCDFTMMHATAEERIIEWNEGKNITIEVYKLKNMPWIQTTTLNLELSPTGGNTTILRGTLVYTMKNCFFDLINTLIMKQKNASLLDGILAGHKLYIETGTIVDEKTKLDLDKVQKIQ